VVGDKAHQNTVEPYGLGRRNQRGEMLIDFCERNGLVITNTWFKKPKRRFTPGNHQGIGVDINWTMY
jgi:hypothetical protein